MASTALLGALNRIEVPYVEVCIGDFRFGVYQKTAATAKDSNGTYQASKIIYPNYVKSLTVKKINGQVNEYTLNLVYPIRPGDDPNFFEKVFSSVSKTRKIVFSYGDMALPNYIYKNEQAVITRVSQSFDLRGATINYTVNAVSSAALSRGGSYNFPTKVDRPSNIIRQLLTTKVYGLQDLFYGMSNMASVDALGLIPGDDKVVTINAKSNISILDYLNYLVSCMIPASATGASVKQDTFYIMTIHDEVIGETINNTVVETLGGPYFQVSHVTKTIKQADAYEVTVGYPTENIVMSFSVSDNENYSIYYDWQQKINDQQYVLRLNDDGDWESTFAPVASSKNTLHQTQSSDSTWWTKITEYPISANISIKGLLRPAILMSYVRLNVLFFGKKHISSGLYIVTEQVDTIDQSGYRTQLSLTKVSGDDEAV